MADKREDNEPKGSRELPAAETTSTISAKTLERKRMPPRTSTDPRYLKFAAALYKIGDSTKAYFATHPLCKSSRQAKERGRALSRMPEVMLEMERLRTQSLEGAGQSDAGLTVFSEGGSSASKIAWENELHLLAFSKVNIRKIPVKEKLLALRTLGESKGWLDKRQPQQGIRATFNFHIGGKTSTVAGRTLTVDAGALEEASAGTGEAHLVEASDVTAVQELPAAVEAESRRLFNAGNT